MKSTICIFFLSFISSSVFSQIQINTNLPNVIGPSDELNVEVKITKSDIEGFAKYQMDVPAGIKAGEGNSLQGSFTFEEQRIKIVWVNIPGEKEFIFSFKLNTGNKKGEIVLNQKFFYLVDGAKKDTEAEPLTINIQDGATTSLASLTLNENASDPISTNENPDVKTNPVVNSNTVTNNPEIKKENGQGITYRLQLGAFGTDPGKSRFSNAGSVSIIQENGLYKVQLGSFSTKEEALAKRSALLQKGIESFIAAYKDGKRL
ncbi:MAG: SPOR domain-containing protein [Sphingobacteriaceae bacterium]|nr:SPOR domain-containing protein [Sphingobacteriaceae bacterium]